MQLKVEVKIIERKEFKKDIMEYNLKLNVTHGYTRKIKKGYYEICLNKSTPEKKKDFIQLHEIGHIFSDYFKIPKKLNKDEKEKLLRDDLFVWKDLKKNKEKKIDEICANLFYFCRGKDLSYINHFKSNYPKTWILYVKQLKKFKPCFNLIKQKEVKQNELVGRR